MSESTQNGFGVTAEDIRRYDWQSLLSDEVHLECRDIWCSFRSAIEECRTAGDDVGQRVYSLLYSVAYFRADYEVKGNPYGSLIKFVDGSHTLCAEELTDADRLALKGTVEGISNPEFRARVADVLWVTEKDIKAARLAVVAFVESAQRLKCSTHSFQHISRLNRAAQICSNKGFEAERATVLSAIEASIVECDDRNKPTALCHNLMKILLAVRQGDPEKYALLSERIAADCAGKCDWHLCEMYWQLAAQWHHQAKRADDRQRCQLAAAECNICRGEAMLAEHGSMSAAHWYGRGVEALRRAKADPERIKTVHRRFLELEKLGLKEMKHLDVDLDKDPEFRAREKETQERAAAFMRGLDFQTAMDRFVQVAQPTDVEALKKAYLKASEGMIAGKLFGSSVVDHAGKVADWVPPQSLSSDEMDPESLRKLLCQQASRFDWPIRVIWMIEPARMAILDEHPVSQQELLYLVVNNPFIPPGHEGIYLRGLQTGFLGDWLVAIHLLVPQIEASIRHVLQQRGVVTSTLVEGIQQERDLNQLLWLPEVEMTFGVDMMFDLRGILIERFGHNLRNQLAHGLLPEGGFYREASAYLWWLILRLCWIGFRLVPPDEETAEA